MTVGVPINHPLAKRDQVCLSDMLNDTFILNSANKDFHISDSGQNFFRHRFPNVKLKFMEFTSRDIVFDTVAKGGGVITSIFRVSREHPGVKWLNLSDWNATTYGIFIYRRDVRSKALVNFRKCVEEIAQKDNL